jgi:hypothetical protein
MVKAFEINLITIFYFSKYKTIIYCYITMLIIKNKRKIYLLLNFTNLFLFVATTL